MASNRLELRKQSTGIVELCIDYIVRPVRTNTQEKIAVAEPGHGGPVYRIEHAFQDVDIAINGGLARGIEVDDQVRTDTPKLSIHVQNTQTAGVPC